MRFLDKMRETVTRISHGKAGYRFVDFYHYRKNRDRGSIVREIGMVGLGVLFLAIGVVGVLLPVLPGFLFLIPGIAVFVARSRLLAVGLDRLELHLRRLLEQD